MRQRPKPVKSKAKVPVAPKSPKDEDARIRDLEKRLAEALKRESQALGQLQTRNRELVEAHEQQTATSEILRIISGSAADVLPVFDAILQSALTLCGAPFGVVLRLEDDVLRLAAFKGTAQSAEIMRKGYPQPLTRDRISGLAILESRAVQAVGLRSSEQFPHARALANAAGFDSTVFVPILREGHPIGAIGVGKAEAFSDKHIALLQTFADQAVIAIENVRLFKELEGRNRELTEALEQQTATSEILRVISNSPTAVQPVFDAIAHSAARLCGAAFASVVLTDGAVLTLAASTFEHDAFAPFASLWPMPVEGSGLQGIALRERTIVVMHDAESDNRIAEWARPIYHTFGLRSGLWAPMVRDGVAIGLVFVVHEKPAAFVSRHVVMLQTFAEQAVIAIENVRLFKELQEKNDALTRAHAQVTEALEQQTATSEILRVIASSPTDLQPVFETIVRSAALLCDAARGGLVLIEGDRLCLASAYPQTPESVELMRRHYPRPVDTTSLIGHAILERRVVHVPDLESPDVPPLVISATRQLGFRSYLTVPMFRDGQPIGAIAVSRLKPGAFSDNQIELLKTFADQAVIAIENVRLFKELETRNRDLTEALEQQTATAEILGVMSRSPADVGPVFDVILSSATRLCAAHLAVLWLYEGDDRFSAVAFHGASPQYRTWLTGSVHRVPPALFRVRGPWRPAHIEDATAIPHLDSHPLIHASVEVEGMRTILGVPLVKQDELVGAVTIYRREVSRFSDQLIALIETFANQAVIVIENVRLFKELEASNREIADKSRQIEVASQHKSEFLANMSHELRTPLNAIIGFSEVLTDRMFGELNDKQDEYLKDIYASGTHLLSLINDILDLSKIEAGRMELELTDFDLPTALDNALTLVRERAGRRNITLQMGVDERLGEVRADERKIRQVVLNLLSNAIKFTSEGGRIEVAAVPKDGSVEVSVSDTGVGIAPEDQEAVFEEFRQVGTADKKAEGTGLGLTLCRKFIELHGGRIWVTSQVGAGSTFTSTIPVHRRD